MTIMEALQWGTEQLKTHEDTDAETGIRLDSPSLDAQVLLAAAMEMSKSWIFTHFDADVPPPRLERYRAFIARRLQHEPVAYIIGWKEFYGRKFLVNPSVLIPRPATETLVDVAKNLAGTSEQERTLFADIGTGSGAIAVTLAAETGIPVVASDVSPEALDVAKQNRERLGMTEQVDIRTGPLLEPVARMFEKLKEKGRRSPIHHLILCANLPYLTEHQWSHAQKDVQQFEPRLALVAGADGLDAYWGLFRELMRMRRTIPHRVSVLCEIDPAQAERMPILIRHDFPHARPHLQKDLDGFDRVVITEL
ncbi:MAG: Release factor glutamine methyltransferase [Candidatus Uhrbacteria bacterium GW2011_GWA2_53_10]|uniref:Release factor glutamine methyltransferase n=1 Tax=Candidatus Uhrbacteria bacterium GW2011_GWA2_53_10 TaxID=1618980 RepID=A0A0G1XP31_9BACT|nr:MAG: Release factor glutamine methyltransferase [Candidatus Uhrbacteria bacterium GW2011_GWA2_53_10]